LLPNEGQTEQLPSCGVIVEKNEEGEKQCELPGSHVIFMVDPETRSTVTAILVACNKHNDALEMGEQLIFLSEDGEDHILVNFTKEIELDDANEPTNA
jgi:hypothetical protein